jgi:neuropeptide S receptor 1
MASATFILTAMSCDRYVAICHPLRLTGDHVTAARRVIAGAWLLACLLASPQLFIFLQVSFD